MRRFLTVAALTLLPSMVSAEPTGVPTFAGIPWGASDTSVVEAAATAGLQLVGKDADGDYEFAGELFGAQAVVYAFMSPTGGLVKVQVRLATPTDRPVSKYTEVVHSISEQYGTTEQVELFKAPYRKGDGLEDEAVRAGKGLLLSAWGDDRQPGQASLVIRVTKLVVGMDYESHGWAAELNRRKEQASEDDGPRVADARPLAARRSTDHG
jgi:hypothetical protein